MDLAYVLEDPAVARWRRKVGELKAPAVVEMLKSQLLDGHEKVVVFAYHHSVLDLLANGLGMYAKTGPSGASGTRWVGRIDGDTPDAKRAQAIEWFQNVRGPAVLLAQNTAVGTGTDGLQVASNRCILVEPSWAWHENEQMAKRLARIGGSATVTAQMVSLAGTLDDYIVQQNQREVEWHTRIFGAAS
jgi:SNF2 family DNA or RNA helicase